MRHLVHPLRRWLGAILLVAVPVVPSPRAAVGPLPASDAALATAVQARLARSARLFASRPPRVSATGGTVRLSGTVPDLATRRRAVRIAAGQRGVLEIETDLPVAGRNRTDRALRIQIDAQLATHADLRPPRVTTTVDGGRVIVQGQVNSVGRYLFVRDRLEHISGLSEIDLSNLTIESRQDGPIDDDDLRDAMVSLIRDP
ncbi:MAG: BON domain-containing protein, partial [Acidobacteriota bacterium]